MFNKKIKVFVLVLLLTAIGTYICIYNLYKSKISETGLNELVTRINNSEKLPDKLIEYYLKVENYDINKSTNKFLSTYFFDRVLDLELKKCPCYETNYGYGVWDTFERISLGIQLDKRVKKRKCIEYYLLNEVAYDSNSIGIKKASLNFFNKDLNALSNSELLKLVVISTNPYHYKNIKRKHILDEKVLYWEKKLNQ